MDEEEFYEEDGIEYQELNLPKPKPQQPQYQQQQQPQYQPPVVEKEISIKNDIENFPIPKKIMEKMCCGKKMDLHDFEIQCVKTSNPQIINDLLDYSQVKLYQKYRGVEEPKKMNPGILIIMTIIVIVGVLLIFFGQDIISSFTNVGGF